MRLLSCRSVVGGMAIIAIGFAMVIPTPAVRAQAGQQRAEIREGTCDGLGDVAFALTGAGAEKSGATPAAVVETLGSDEAVPLAVSETELEISLSQLIETERVIAVYDGDEATDEPAACGSIGGPLTMQMAGMVMPGDELAVGLAEVDDSGYFGIALISAEGTKAKLRLFLIEDSAEAR